MIRLADYKDTKICLALVREFLKDTSYSQLGTMASDNLDNLCKVIWTVQQHGYIWLGFVEDQPAGILMAVKEPNMWLPVAKELREIVWFVDSKFRNTTLGGRLFLEYCKKGDQLLKEGVIQGYFTTRMPTTAAIDLDRRGFRLVENTYIKERL